MAGGPARAVRGREGADPAKRRAGAAAAGGAALGPHREKDRFETDAGTASPADLFAGGSQLLIYHFMFGAQYTAGCPYCSAITDGFDGSVARLANHDVTLCAVTWAPLVKLQAD